MWVMMTTITTKENEITNTIAIDIVKVYPNDIYDNTSSNNIIYNVVCSITIFGYFTGEWGGLLGVIIGFSLISAVEVIYFYWLNNFVVVGFQAIQKVHNYHSSHEHSIWVFMIRIFTE